MAGFIIHLAIGEQYIKKHKEEIKNKNEFINGIIAPDLDEKMTDIEKNKSKSHYGDWKDNKTITNIDKFLKDKEVNMGKDYWKGYFLHLLTDYYFYNIIFHKEYMQSLENNEKFYYDYDCLNGELIKKYKELEKYKVEQIKKYIDILKEKPKYLKLDKVILFIEKISDFDIGKKVEIIKEKGMEGL